MDEKLTTSIQTLKEYCKNTRCNQCEIGKVIKCVRVDGESCVPSLWNNVLKEDKKENVFEVMKKLGIKRCILTFLAYNFGILLGCYLGCAFIIIFNYSFVATFEQPSIISVIENILMWCCFHLYIVLPILVALYVIGYMWLLKNYWENIKQGRHV